MKKKVIRISTVPISLNLLLQGQLGMLAEEYEVVAVSSPGKDLDEVAEREGVRTVAVPMERRIAPLKDLVSLWRLMALFRKEKPYLVHSLTPKAGLLAMMAAWMCGVPARVHTFTGLVFPTARGLRRKLLMATDRLTCRCATCVNPEGKGVANDLQRFGITGKPLRIVGNGNINGVDLEWFSRSEEVMEKALEIREKEILEKTDSPCLGNSGSSLSGEKIENTESSLSGKKNSSLSESTKSSLSENKSEKEGISSPQETKPLSSDDPLIYCFVGRIVGDKGINELVAAFERLYGADRRVRLLLVGPFEEQLDPVLPETRQRIMHHPAIRFMGWQADIRPFLAAADVFVFPSYREGFPNVVLQAGAMGLPCIVTDINGCNEIVAEGVNGVIIPPRDTEALYTAMVRLADGDLRAPLAATARKRIGSRYDRKELWKELREFYHEL